MAITYYVGVPRSGKTYKAMHDIYVNFIEKRKPKSKFNKLINNLGFNDEKETNYDYCYTNINQFNFDISEKIKPFDYDLIYSNLSELYALYIAKAEDSELIQKAKDFNIYNSLFVIDECHNYLKSKDDKVLVWWFTYHAHLHHELILITQDLTLVNNEYKRVAEYFYKAIPSRFRLSKNTFKYVQYASYSMYQKDKINTTSIKANPKIFELYVSGKDSNGKSIIHKYLIFTAIILLICLVLIYRFMNNMNGSDNTPGEEDIKTENTELTTPGEDIKNVPAAVAVKIKESKIKDLQLYKFNCFVEYCYYFDNGTTYDIPTNILKTYLQDLDEERKFLKLKNNRLIIHILDDKNKFNFLKGTDNEEKNSNNLLPIK